MVGNNPFEVDDDDNVTQRRVEEVRQKVAQTEEGDVEVDPNEEDDEEVETTAPQGGIHQQKKRERVSRFKEEAESARAETERLRTENIRLDAARVAAETAARITRQDVPQKDEHEEKLKKVRSQKDNLYQAYQAREQAYLTAKQKMPDDELSNYRKQAQELNDEEDELKLERFSQKRGLGQQAPNTQVEVITGWLNMEYPDVMASADAKRYAALRYETLKAEGHLESKETVALAMAQTRANPKLNLASRPAPTAASRAMYAGTSGRPAKRMTETGNGKIVMTPAMQGIALQTFSKLAKEKGDDAAIKHWAKTVGPSYMAQRAQRDRRRA